MRICFIVNNSLKQRPTYTTAHLAFSAASRGHDVLLVGVDNISLSGENRVFALGLRPPSGHYESCTAYIAALQSHLSCKVEVELNEFDLVWLRNNPAEASRSSLLGNVVLDVGRILKRRGVLVLNDPDGLSRARSKMYLLQFPQEIRPKTLISRNPVEIKRFVREQNAAVILKPLDRYGGENVFYLRRGQVSNLNQMIQVIQKFGYVLAQEYLPQAKKGETRLLLLHGEPIDCGEQQFALYKRRRPKDDIRHNMHRGAYRRRAKLGETERNIAKRLQAKLLEDGLDFVGVDIVGDKVLEINVVAPGGIHNINELYQVDVASRILKSLEERVFLKNRNFAKNSAKEYEAGKKF